MKAPEERLRIGSCDLLVLGTIPGFVPDAERVRQAFAAHGPRLVALGIPPEDIGALDSLATSEAARGELVEPDVASERLLKLLERFGPTRIPSPDLEAAHALAKESGARLEGIDLDDVTHSSEYVARVKVRHLWWAPRREARLLRRGFEDAPDAYSLVARWDEEQHASRPLRQMEALREAHMARRLRSLAGSSDRILAVVPAARAPGVVRALRADGAT